MAETAVPEKKLKTDSLFINLGPQHPSTHGVLRLGLTIEGEMITKAVPDIGYLHRGTAKLRRLLEKEPGQWNLKGPGSATTPACHRATSKKQQAIPTPRTTRPPSEEVAGHRDTISRLADGFGLTGPRLRDDGAVVVPSPEGCYGNVFRLSADASELVGRYVHVITDDVPGAIDAKDL